MTLRFAIFGTGFWSRFQLAVLDKMPSCPTGSPAFVIAQVVEHLAVERAKVGIEYAAGGYGRAAVAGLEHVVVVGVISARRPHALNLLDVLLGPRAALDAAELDGAGAGGNRSTPRRTVCGVSRSSIVFWRSSPS